MREIKFRAWIGDRNYLTKVVSYIKHKVGFQISYRDSVTDEELGLMSSHSHKITLMQYTGLKDKNGVEIYEGDIVRIVEDDEDSVCGNTFEYVCAVSYGNSLKLSTYTSQYPYSFCLINKRFYMEQALISSLHFNSEIEVIGNIYENKELLNA